MDTLELGLTGKVVIVTGASEGLGLACAQRFGRSGARVAMCARRADVLAAASESVRAQTGAAVFWKAADVTQADEVAAFVAAVTARFGGIDVLVNNAGTSAAKPFLAVDDDAWQYDFELKVMAAIRFCRLVVPSMKTRGGGAIVNVTTIGGKAPGVQALPTSLSRAAGISLSKSLANEYAKDGIRVNTVCLGIVKSAQWARRVPAGGDLDAFYREVASQKQIPLGRVGEPEEFADLVAFLVSNRARFITGTAINFDGGASPVT